MKTQVKNPRVAFLGPLPPPFMGPTLATGILLRSRLAEECQLRHIDTSDHRSLSTLGAVDFWNLYLALKHYVQLFFCLLLRRIDIVYIPISQTTLGYIRDAGFIFIAKLFRAKVVCHLRGGNFRNWYNRSRPITQQFVRWVHARVDGQIVLGEVLRPLFRGFLPEERIFVVPNGRDFEDLRPKESAPPPCRILFLSNFKVSKGVMDFLEAALLVRAAHPGCRFILAGDWGIESINSKVKAFLDSHPELPVDLVIPARGPRKAEVFDEADIFVFPTYYPAEGHPWVVIEAMAAGLPVISTDQGAIRESVFDGQNGFIVEKKNPEQIADRIKRLLGEPDLCRRMGRESRRLYEDKFTERHMVDGMKRVFESVLRRRCAG